MPIRVRLKHAAPLESPRNRRRRGRRTVSPTGRCLSVNPQGTAKRGQPAQIADAAKRIGKGQPGFQVQVKRSGGNRLRRRRQHVERIEQVRHLFLQNIANALRLDVIRARKLLIDVTVDLSERVGQFTYFSGANQRAKRSRAFDSHDEVAAASSNGPCGSAKCGARSENICSKRLLGGIDGFGHARFH